MSHIGKITPFLCMSSQYNTSGASNRKNIRCTKKKKRTWDIFQFFYNLLFKRKHPNLYNMQPTSSGKYKTIKELFFGVLLDPEYLLHTNNETNYSKEKISSFLLSYF